MEPPTPPDILPEIDPLAWRELLAARIKILVEALAGVDEVIGAFAAAIARDRRVSAAWAIRAILPPSLPQPGRRPGRPRGSKDRYPRLPRGTLRPNGHGEG